MHMQLQYIKPNGSEFDVVIRNLLYTGMTRAKKMLIIVGNSSVVNYMIQNIDTKKRNTGLMQKLINE